MIIIYVIVFLWNVNSCVLVLVFNLLSSVALSGIIKELFSADDGIHCKTFFEFYNDNTFLQSVIL